VLKQYLSAHQAVLIMWELSVIERRRSTLGFLHKSPRSLRQYDIEVSPRATVELVPDIRTAGATHHACPNFR
jgi:hypothetical protein